MAASMPRIASSQERTFTRVSCAASNQVKRIKDAGAVLLLAFMLPIPDASATVLWDESVNGDLSGNYAGALVNGTNTILGSSTFFFDLNIKNYPTLDWDIFTVDAPTGTTINGITLTISNVNITDSAVLKETYHAYKGSTDLGMAYAVEISNANEGIATDFSGFDSPVAASGLYFPQSFSFGGPVVNASWDWAININASVPGASSIPEPGNLLLTLSALGLLGLVTRTKSKGSTVD